jgi:hypothetical protein
VLVRASRIDNLRTARQLTYTLRHDGGRLLLTIAGGLTPPRGGLVFSWPSAGKPGRASSNGRPMPWKNDKELRIHALPAVIAIEMAVDGKKLQ